MDSVDGWLYTFFDTDLRPLVDGCSVLETAGKTCFLGIKIGRGIEDRSGNIQTRPSLADILFILFLGVSVDAKDLY